VDSTRGLEGSYYDGHSAGSEDYMGTWGLCNTWEGTTNFFYLS